MKFATTLVLSLCVAGVSWAQDVIAAKGGLIHYIEGDVSVAGKPVTIKAGDFPEMKDGQELRTSLGRAEVLLGPGVFLRLSENSAFRLQSGAIENTRIELTAGSLLLEAGEFNSKYHAIVVKAGNTNIEVTKSGLYRIDLEPGLVQVHDGEVALVAGGEALKVKEGRQAAFGPVPVAEKFNKERTDAFHRWASRRSSYIAAANIAAARKIREDGTLWGGMGSSWGNVGTGLGTMGMMSWRNMGGWIYNPYLGSMTYIPTSGLYHSPFGWAFYSPRTVQRVYYRPPVQAYNPPNAGFGSMDRGSIGGSRSYSGYSGGSSMGTYSSGGSVAPPPAAAPAPSGGARGGGGGGGGRSASGGR